MRQKYVVKRSDIKVLGSETRRVIVFSVKEQDQCLRTTKFETTNHEAHSVHGRRRA